MLHFSTYCLIVPNIKRISLYTFASTTSLLHCSIVILIIERAVPILDKNFISISNDSLKRQRNIDEENLQHENVCLRRFNRSCHDRTWNSINSSIDFWTLRKIRIFVKCFDSNRNSSVEEILIAEASIRVITRIEMTHRAGGNKCFLSFLSPFVHLLLAWCDRDDATNSSFELIYVFSAGAYRKWNMKMLRGGYHGGKRDREPVLERVAPGQIRSLFWSSR